MAAFEQGGHQGGARLHIPQRDFQSQVLEFFSFGFLGGLTFAQRDQQPPLEVPGQGIGRLNPASLGIGLQSLGQAIAQGVQITQTDVNLRPLATLQQRGFPGVEPAPVSCLRRRQAQAIMPGVFLQRLFHGFQLRNQALLRQPAIQQPHDGFQVRLIGGTFAGDTQMVPPDFGIRLVLAIQAHEKAGAPAVDTALTENEGGVGASLISTATQNLLLDEQFVPHRLNTAGNLGCVFVEQRGALLLFTQQIQRFGLQQLELGFVMAVVLAGLSHQGKGFLHSHLRCQDLESCLTGISTGEGVDSLSGPVVEEEYPGRVGHPLPIIVTACQLQQGFYRIFKALFVTSQAGVGGPLGNFFGGVSLGAFYNSRRIPGQFGPGSLFHQQGWQQPLGALSGKDYGLVELAATAE